MLIQKHPWNKKKVRRLINYLYTAKTRRDPMTHYMKDELSSEMLYYLLLNPSFFANYYFYQQFVQMYFPQFASEHPTYTQMLIQNAMMQDYQRRQQKRHQHMYEINYQRLVNDTNRRIRQDKRILHNLQLNIDIDRIIRETTRELTEQHEHTLERTINQLANQIEKDGLIDVPDISKNKKLQEKLDKYNKQIERENKRLEKNRTNRILWQKARLLDDKYKPTFKVWDQHPNPKTRHNLTDGQKVLLEEKFIVINDKTGDLDYVDYPGDWTCSASNSANCLCTLSFTNDPTGYKPHDKLIKEYKKYSNTIKIEKQYKKEQKQHFELYESVKQLFKRPNQDYTYYKIKDFFEDTSMDEKIILLTKKLKGEFPKEFNEKTIFNIIKFSLKFKDDYNEHGMILDFKEGIIKKTNDGIENHVSLSFKEVKDTRNLLTLHSHPLPKSNEINVELQSPQDLLMLLKRPMEKYSVVTSKNHIWIIKNNQKIINNNHTPERIAGVYEAKCYKYFDMLKQGIDEEIAFESFEKEFFIFFEKMGLEIRKIDVK